jgi:hypothetical protein
MPAPRRIPPILFRPHGTEKKRDIRLPRPEHFRSWAVCNSRILARITYLALMLGASQRQRRVLFRRWSRCAVDARAQAPEERHVASLGLMFESPPWVYKHGAPPALSEIFVSASPVPTSQRDAKWLTILGHAACLFRWKCAS